MPQVCGRAREADEWCARCAGLSQFVADEDCGAIFRGAQRRARSQPLSDLLWGGEFAELNIGLMPGLVSSYKQGAAWKQAEVGRKFNQFLAGKGVIMVSWIWQAGGVASRSTPIVYPQDVKGLKVRGGSREMDMVLQAAGATTLTTPSNELYAAMQTGACDAAITSST